MKTFRIPCAKGLEFTFTRNTYANNNTYIGLVCRENGIMEPFDDLTVILGMPLPKNLAYIHVNHFEQEFLDALEKQGFITPTDGRAVSGYVTYPLYILHLDKIQEYMQQGQPKETEEPGMRL